jgi:soluble lytic murein transglycosylase-like protein
MEGVILKKAHHQFAEKARKRILRVHLIWAFVAIGLAGFLGIQTVSLNHLRQEEEAIQLELRLELQANQVKREILEIFRTKPLTVGQALDVADIIMNQKKIPVGLLLGILEQESQGNPMAVSSKGALGLMQVMPGTYQIVYASNPPLQAQQKMHSPALNVTAGIAYLSDLWEQFHDWQKVLRAYYAGPEQANNKKFDWYAKSVILKARKFGFQP